MGASGSEVSVARPLVGIVVVNYNGADLTLRCIERLHELTWPADRTRVVLVDNGSDDAVADNVRSAWPDVEVVETGENLGFAGGCNRGFDRLSDADFVALCNNDALPERGWLEPLVECLERDTTVGAATPKVLMASQYSAIDIETETSRVGAADPRALGVQIVRIRIGEQDVTDDVEFAGGVWGVERDDITIGGEFRWTSGAARVLVPAPAPGSGALSIELACGLGRRHVRLRSGDTVVDTDVAERQVRVVVPRARFVDVINNTGTVRLADGSVADRGFLEPDDGQYDELLDISGWSGAAVLLRRAFLDDVGAFDERLFLYYEDADLSWRGAQRGWAYRYVPESVVRHEHSATTGAVARLVRHLAGRNRLVVLTKLAPREVAFAALRTFAGDIAGAAWRDVVHRLVRARKPNATEVVLLARIAGGYVRLAPGALAFRWRRVSARSATRNAGAGG